MEPVDPERFKGKLQEYLEYVTKNKLLAINPDWCAKHWAPCPVDGKNGILASILILEESFAFLPEGVISGGATAINSWRSNQLAKTCCRLGDKKIRFLWWMCDLGPEQLCFAHPPESGPGGRVCWRPKNHPGEHEWERPYPRSLFDLMPEFSNDPTRPV